jgi:hypothetical protein
MAGMSPLGRDGGGGDTADWHLEKWNFLFFLHFTDSPESDSAFFSSPFASDFPAIL